MMRASVIVPVYNGAAVIEGCLGSLDRQTLEPSDYEVIVVDDGSTDGTPQIVEGIITSARASIRFVQRPANAGPAAARNAGLREATTEVIAFTDADCEVAPDWLERALEVLASSDAVAVEGRTDPKGEPGTLTHQMRNPSGGLWMTCNMIYRRAALDDVGGFDERFRMAFLEDSDVAFAVQERGGEIAWAPEVLVNHLVLQGGRRTFFREARKRFYNPLLYRKHPQMYRRHLKPVVPGIPGLHWKYMGLTIAPLVAWGLGFPGASVLLAPVWAFWFRRVAHAYKARDVVSFAQVAVHPFVQTFWVIAGAIKFGSWAWDL